MSAEQAAVTDWRRPLLRKIGWLLAFKLAALVILWLLFFSPPHRVAVDSEVMSERLTPAADHVKASENISRKDGSGDA